MPSSMLVRDPVYLQLNRALRDLIRSAEVQVGGQFLTEREISQRFSVSRATANKALSNLVAEGVLEFRKGIGTFVRNGGGLDYDVRSLVSFTDKALAAGKKPSTRVIAFGTLRAAEADASLAGQLQASGGEELFSMERLRLADGVPVILERRHVVARFCPGLRQADVRGSLYAVWTDRYKLEIAGARQTIRAVNITGPEARLLEIKPRSAGFLVSSVGHLADGQALWAEQTLYRGDAYEFHSQLGPIQACRPAAGALIDSLRRE